MRVLHEMEERCDYSTQKNKLIRDRLVLEIRDVWPCPKKLQMEGQTDSGDGDADAAPGRGGGERRQ